jgi:osmotically-inducible protein OsmY
MKLGIMTVNRNSFGAVAAAAALCAALGGGASPAYAESTTALDEQDIGPVLREGRTVDEQTVRDMETAGDIRIALLREPGLQEHLIHVEVQNGKVMLSGMVAGSEARETALSIARQVAGDDAVEDRLRTAGR